MNISIIIPSYNGKKILAANLPAVIKACRHWSPSGKHWQIIVVDDASTDFTTDWIKKTFPLIHVLTNQKNLRFAKAVNHGVHHASADIIVLLNNDVRPQENFLEPLLKHFTDKQVFAVGCLEKNLVNGKQLLGGRGLGKFSRGFLVHRRPKNQTKPNTLWVAAGSAAFRKSIWDKLNGLDPLFRPAYEEDRDLSYNALKAGYKIVFEPLSKVTHVHETSNLKAFGRNRINVISFKNQFLFVWKNISNVSWLISHLLWLPYHLIFTSIKTRGLFFVGFLTALKQFFEVIAARKRAKKLWRLTDQAVLKQIQ